MHASMYSNAVNAEDQKLWQATAFFPKQYVHAQTKIKKIHFNFSK